jgi:hypothetical protein
MPVDAADFLAVRTDLRSVELNEVIDGINLPVKCHRQTVHFGKITFVMTEKISEQ